MAYVPDATHTSPTPSPSQLLRLTPEIRLRLYRYLGLATWNGQPYQFDFRGGSADCKTYAGCPPDPIEFHGLLISCRTIYAEAAALLYSTNSFVVQHHAPAQLHGLHSLGALTEASLRSLSQLKIVINEAACHNRVTENDYSEDRCCWHSREKYDWSDVLWCRNKHSDIHQAPFLSDGEGVASADDAQRAWHSAAARLFSHITPGRLALSLVCDIDPQHPRALNLAESILAPLYLLPRSYLSKCQIRLAKVPYWPLEKLARDAAVHACGLPTPVPHTSEPLNTTATATLASLPRELRIRILEYTDLVAPRRQVIWSRQDRAYVVLRFRRVAEPPLNPDEAHAEQFFECYRGRPEGCFCRRRHATFSLHCRCWAPPGPALFLVCRTLSQEAQHVFFSRNRFIVHDYKVFPTWWLPSLQPSPSSDPHSPQHGAYPFKRFVASEFLRDVVPAPALSHLRFLELVFPPYPPTTWPGPDHPAVRDWAAVVGWLRDRLNLPVLTLRVVVTDESNGTPDRARGATPEEAATQLGAYTALLRPLQRLAEPPGLARFYAHFQYPWETAPWDLALYQPPGPWYDPCFHKRDLKERLERYVMGARYESLYADGRKEPGPSDWDYMYFADRPW
ncbi:predicted protein [Chaetomium globosum CBS 148.51]|uniref:F-box domain-containing protein n=1 Tax=Chaetomium globosum (strain ATCC 6205 / CBS 148.51 / DSM 1962 / NBRC 6347 / NRRL 1970) TaxID=306901 RepID=Q2HI36_CHAGB|nr:uncharacterized protein CHGG_00118 [Chaetomium globosum CBS 148.51]EAQ91883.1 predicted protein [Chaetomium globosum CBS 148.51]